MLIKLCDIICRDHDEFNLLELGTLPCKKFDFASHKSAYSGEIQFKIYLLWYNSRTSSCVARPCIWYHRVYQNKMEGPLCETYYHQYITYIYSTPLSRWVDKKSQHACICVLHVLLRYVPHVCHRVWPLLTLFFFWRNEVVSLCWRVANIIIARIVISYLNVCVGRKRHVKYQSYKGFALDSNITIIPMMISVLCKDPYLQTIATYGRNTIDSHDCSLDTIQKAHNIYIIVKM